LDTSSLIKLYHTEKGTEELDYIFEHYDINKIYLSGITKIEYVSAILKKVRTNDLMLNEAQNIIDSFEADYSKYPFVNINFELLNIAKNMLSKYGTSGLRTLDSIQLASILIIKSKISFAVTSDNLLQKFISMEDIITK
jgi:predicted nucleic acid-binding protein